MPYALRCFPTCAPYASGSPTTYPHTTSEQTPSVLVHCNEDAASIAYALLARGIPVEVRSAWPACYPYLKSLMWWLCCGSSLTLRSAPRQCAC